MREKLREKNVLFLFFYLTCFVFLGCIFGFFRLRLDEFNAFKSALELLLTVALFFIELCSI